MNINVMMATPFLSTSTAVLSAPTTVLPTPTDLQQCSVAFQPSNILPVNTLTQSSEIVTGHSNQQQSSCDEISTSSLLNQDQVQSHLLIKIHLSSKV